MAKEETLRTLVEKDKENLEALKAEIEQYRLEMEKDKLSMANLAERY